MAAGEGRGRVVLVVVVVLGVMRHIFFGRGGQSWGGRCQNDGVGAEGADMRVGFGSGAFFNILRRNIGNVSQSLIVIILVITITDII